MDDDADDRKRRAAAIRRRIAKMKEGGAPQPPSESETPNEFVHRRMRELERTQPEDDPPADSSATPEEQD